MTDLQASMLIITLNVIEERIQKKSSTFTLKNQEIRTNGNSIITEEKEITKYQISVEVKSINKIFENYDTKSMFFGTINKIDKPLTQNDWGEGDTITNMKYETVDIITDTTDNKK